MRIKTIEQNPKIHFLAERISGQNTWQPGIKEGWIVALQPADKAYKTASCFLQLKNERHNSEFLPFFFLSALFWPLPLMPRIFKIFSSLSCLLPFLKPNEKRCQTNVPKKKFHMSQCLYIGHAALCYVM